MQLTEKQKVKFVYGIMEKQFRCTMRRPPKPRARPVRTC